MCPSLPKCVILPFSIPPRFNLQVAEPLQTAKQGAVERKIIRDPLQGLHSEVQVGLQADLCSQQDKTHLIRLSKQWNGSRD